MTRRDLTVMLVVPDTNTTMEPEVRALWPGIGELHRVGIPRPMRALVASDLPEYGANTLRAVAALGSVKPDVIVYGCTTAGFLAGPEGDAEMQRRLADAVGAPAVTTASAMVDALRRAGVSHPAVVTPYLEKSNQGLKDFLAAKGIEVPLLNSFLCPTADALGAVTRDEVQALAEQTGADARADGLFIACTQLPTLGILEALRERLGKPVLGAIEATVASARRAVGGR